MNVREVRVGPAGSDRPSWLALQERAPNRYGLARRAFPDQPEPDGLWLRLAAEEGDRMVAGLSVRVEGDLAAVQPFGPLVDPDFPLDGPASALWAEARVRLTAWGVREAAATMRYPPDRRAAVEPLIAWYRRTGLEVAERVVMVRPLEFPDVAAAGKNAPPNVTFVTWAGRSEAELADLFRLVFGDQGRRPVETISGRRGAYDQARTVLALEGDRPVGFASVTLHPDDALLADIGVSPGDRRRGLGTALLGRAYEAALRAGRRRLSLVLEAGDGTAREFFEGCGFTAVTEVGLARWTPSRPAVAPLAVVTGGAGYVGQQLVRRLLGRGWRVRCLVGDQAAGDAGALGALGAEVRHGDILVPTTLRGLFDGAADAYHLVEEEAGDPAAMKLLNVDGTVNVAREAARGKVGAFVVTSSGAVYGDADEEPVDERARTRPRTAYGRSKAAMEEALESLAGRGEAPPLRIARLGTVYGPGSAILPVEEVRHGRFRLIGDGRNWGSYVHRDDVAQALFWVARRGRDGQVYNVCDDRPTTIGRFYELAAERLGAPHLEYIPAGAAKVISPLAGVAGRLGGRRPAVSTETVKAMTASLRMSNSRLRKELGAALTCPTVDIGLAKTLAEGGPNHADRS